MAWVKYNGCPVLENGLHGVGNDAHELLILLQSTGVAFGWFMKMAKSFCAFV